MTDPHPREGDAAEFVLGSLPAAERRAFEGDIRRDPALARAVREWEGRLAPLADALPPVTPRAGIRAALADQLRIGRTATVHPLPTREVTALRRSRGLWRGAAVGSAAIAASLAALLVLNPRPAVPPPTSGLVAVVNRNGDLPALIVRVDLGAGLVQVRTVAAETPPARSLELWSVAPGGAPRSLGVIGQGLTRVALPAGVSGIGPDATLAVSVEPTGGSPTGSPTGPVVYSGKLVPDAP